MRVGMVGVVGVGAVLLGFVSPVVGAPLQPQRAPTMKPTGRVPAVTQQATTSGGRFVLLPNATGSMVQDTTTGRVWERIPSGTLSVWSAAKVACDGKTLGGFGDWRLPRIEELDALFAGPVEQPLPKDHPFTFAFGSAFWSSTDVNQASAQSLRAGNGNLFNEPMTQQRSVWCVRGGGNTAYPNSNPRFQVVGDEVKDVQTGRVWARTGAAQGTWYAARLTCRAKGAAWRLATQGELMGLIDAGAPESPKLPVGHPFVNAWAPYDVNPLWTLDSVSATVARGVRLADGSALEMAKAEVHGGWCVKMVEGEAWPAGPVGRFKLAADGLTVDDQETGLRWERSPVTPGAQWPAVNGACVARTTGGQGGWRLATLDELISLVDFRATTPAKLPAGHPFVAVAATEHWTANAVNAPEMVTLRLENGQTTHMSQSGASLPGWCVRSP